MPVSLTLYDFAAEIGYKSVQVSIEIDNQTEDVIAQTARVFVHTNGYFAAGSVGVGDYIPAWQKIGVTLQLDSLGGASIEKVSSDFVVSLKAGVREVCRQSFSLGFTCFNRGLRKEFRNSKFNILIFGPAGSGKSSFIQTIFTMLSEEDSIVTGVCPVGGGAGHVTTTLRKIDLPDGMGGLWDTWGLTSDQYLHEELSLIVKGVLPSEWEMTDGINKIDKKMIQTAQFRQIDAVIIMVPVGTLADQSELSNLKAQIQKIIGLRLNPILLLAQADTVDKEVRSNPNRFSLEIEKIKQQVAEAFSVPPMMIFPCVPYRVEEKRSFEIDKLAYKILQIALNNAASKRMFDATKKKGYDLCADSEINDDGDEDSEGLGALLSQLGISGSGRGQREHKEKKEKKAPATNRCQVCSSAQSDAIIIHGVDSHQCCCHSCAGTLSNCPRCGKVIDAVVKANAN